MLLISLYTNIISFFILFNFCLNKYKFLYIFPPNINWKQLLKFYDKIVLIKIYRNIYYLFFLKSL